MHGNKRLFGYVNVAFHNRSADGQERVFTTREARDEALAALRERAVAGGLNKGASVAGIYPVVTRASALTDTQRDELEIDGYVEIRA